MAVRDDDLLTAATQVLLRNPTASLAEVAAATGISRTTLYARFPTRQALLVGLAQAAMDLVEKAYVDAGLDGAGLDGAGLDGATDDATAGAAVAVRLARVVERLVPLGERVEFLLRERSLDGEAELVARYAALDEPLVEFVARAQAAGALRADLPAWWIVASLLGGIYSAWEAIADGRLARRDAPDLVLRTVLDGIRPR